MNPQEARAALAVVREGESELTTTERRVALEYFSGENAGNKVRSYLAIFPEASYGTASMKADEILNSSKVKRFLDGLQHQVVEEVMGELKGELRPWIDLLPLAQGIIVATAQGKIRNRLAYEAACYLTNRVLGMPTATVDLHVQNSERIAGATKVFTGRMVAERQKKVG